MLRPRERSQPFASNHDMTVTSAGLIRACKYIDARHGQFRWSQLHFLLVIYENPNIGQSLLGEKVNCTLAAVSRNVDVFGERGSKRNGKVTSPGYKFVKAVRDPDDDRNVLLSLTTKGERFISGLIEETGGS